MIAYSPDPYPGTGNKPITYVPYVIVLPAENRITHRLIPGYAFRCTVHVNGTRHCVLFRR